jgi:NAD(P)-dependent dehydrogenase (short-subunit alcohol dehydrogenase family)
MEDKLDILICNAGIIARDHELTSDGIEKDFHVNHLGTSP